MKKFEVVIIETLSRAEIVEAKDEKEALEKVKEMYMNEEIVLDYSDYVDTEYIVDTFED